MKKLVLAVLGVLCSATMVAGFASCDLLGGGPTNSSSTVPAITYTLDSEKFDKVVAYKSSLDLSDLAIKSSDGKTIALTANGVKVSGTDTNSVGNKTLTVSYNGENMSVSYTVKYEVKFIVDGQPLGASQYVLSASEIKIPTNYTADSWDPAVPETISDNMTFTAGTAQSEVSISLEGNEAFVMNGNVYAMEYNALGSIAVEVDSGVTWTVEKDNENITITEGVDNFLVTSKKAGVTTVTVRATDEESGESAVAIKKIVVKPQNFAINELVLGSSKIEEIPTLGRTEVDGTTVSKFGLTAEYGKADSIGEGLTDNVTWASNNGLASISSNGEITLGASTGAEIVEFTAKLVVDNVVCDVSAPYEVRCVWDGVNVSSYAELYAATKAAVSKPIVLHKDIKEDFSATNYDTMNTTYDDTYYQNKGEEAKIKTLLQFKNDLYGNGYQINAHNATLGWVDSTGAPKADALFKGPLNFVAMGAEESGMLSVKAQDNVCFALFEGVTVNNVELRGCDLKADSDGNYDLTDLDYAGTTVEVFGDNVTIEYSRITNGRTVLRIFGDATNSEKAIHVDIRNSVLSGAREFILRIGSNRFVKDNSNASPYLTGDSNGAYLNAKKLNADNYYGKMTADQKKSYDDSFINTYVNVKNSVFKDAGIFAIGMDAHFAGPALHDPESNNVISSVLGSSAALWKNIAKTSYGAKLTFEGDVRMYNWKPLDQIDSSTLIENLGPEGWTWADLTFDVKTMVKEVSTDPNFATILTNHNGVDYVHAGIAFFGGGRNYSVFENSADTELVGFTVSLDDVGQTMLKTAAGEESFYFMICDQTSNFTPQKQVEMLNSDDAYACLKK